VLCSAEVPGVGEVLARTTPAVDDLCCFGRAGGEVCRDEGGFGSDIVARGEEGGGWTSGSKTFFCNINKQSNFRHSSSKGPQVLLTYRRDTISGDKIPAMMRLISLYL
jgi:hypothetical protein